MTDTRKAMEQALLYIEQTSKFVPHTHDQDGCDAAVSLRSALAQQGGPFAEFQKHGWKKECEDTDKLLAHLGLDPDVCRSEGGWLNLPRIKTALAQRGEPVTKRYPVGGLNHGWAGEYNRGWNDAIDAMLAAAPAAQPDTEQAFKNGYDTGYEAGLLHSAPTHPSPTPARSSSRWWGRWKAAMGTQPATELTAPAPSKQLSNGWRKTNDYPRTTD